jgi:hypothetical protein
MSHAARLRVVATTVAAGVVGVAAAMFPAGASATFSESYGGYAICGGNCYIQSANAHTFALNEDWTTSGSPALACQLFNRSGVNEVSHGGGFCNVGYFGGRFVWARGYNQSGATWVVHGFAET